jgi:hypothetical protein
VGGHGHKLVSQGPTRCKAAPGAPPVSREDDRAAVEESEGGDRTPPSDSIRQDHERRLGPGDVTPVIPIGRQGPEHAHYVADAPLEQLTHGPLSALA